MKVLIAILSCHSLRHCAQAERDTWVPEIPLGVDYKFFLGTKPPESGGFVTQNDEVVLDAPDTWEDWHEQKMEELKQKDGHDADIPETR
jgi:hypothetical protein